MLHSRKQKQPQKLLALISREHYSAVWLAKNRHIKLSGNEIARIEALAEKLA